MAGASILEKSSFKQEDQEKLTTYNYPIHKFHKFRGLRAI